LEIAKTYAASHAEREQNRYASHYNLRSRDKHFDVGEQVLILMPDNTSSHLFSKSMGPATVVDVRSPYSYTVELDGMRRHFHANKLGKFHVRVDSVTSDSLVDDLESKSVNTCAVVYENDTDFGQLNVIPSNLYQPSTVVLQSEKIDSAFISHLSRDQQLELLEVLDRYPECYSDVPSYTDVVTHKLRIRKEYFYDYLRENCKLRKHMLFHVQIEDRICMFDVMF